MKRWWSGLFKTRRPVKTDAQRAKKWEHGESALPLLDKGVYGCPNCGYDKFTEGPSGGASTNVECENCYHRWNAVFMSGKIPWEFIGYGEKYNELRVAVKIARQGVGL